MNAVNDVKQWLLGYLIGLFNADQIVAAIDNLILKEAWYDEFFDLSSVSNYTSGFIYRLLSSGRFKLSNEDFKVFENRLLQVVLIEVQSNQSNWKKASKFLYNFIKTKQQYQNLSSNELDDFWFGVINDNELRRDTLPSTIDNAEGFLELLKMNKLEDYNYIKDLFRLS